MKVTIVLSQAQTTALITALAAVPKWTKTVEALKAKFTEAQAASANAEKTGKVTTVLSGGQTDALRKALASVEKQTKTLEAIQAKIAEAQGAAAV